ncbi:hypothetical protein B9Z55_007117 [Caenorhabditis nigoni]|uniref:Uncharacterized protein n=1 Tax=Caenorhabditis nigoni TaxID=1611254 RepID=A0A2G5V839_9PELO|nr:hypothetical protein B9Z55_007117 [Caenorhabditis nigoni]
MFAGRTVVMTGASRGNGRQIAKMLAENGANLVLAGSAPSCHGAVFGSVFDTAREIEKTGGIVLPIAVDVHQVSSVHSCIEKAVLNFGGIDYLINNSSTLSLCHTDDPKRKRNDLKRSLNSKSIVNFTTECLPHLQKSESPQILNIMKPYSKYPCRVSDKKLLDIAHDKIDDLKEDLFKLVYTPKKYSSIAMNFLWPYTGVWTTQYENHMDRFGGPGSPCLMPSAVATILTARSPSHDMFFVDSKVLNTNPKFSPSDQLMLTPDLKYLKSRKSDSQFFYGIYDSSNTEYMADRVNGEYERIEKVVKRFLKSVDIGKDHLIYLLVISEPFHNRKKFVTLDLKNKPGYFVTGATNANLRIEMPMNECIKAFTKPGYLLHLEKKGRISLTRRGESFPHREKAPYQYQTEFVFKLKLLQHLVDEFVASGDARLTSLEDHESRYKITEELMPRGSEMVTFCGKYSF